MVLTLKNMTDIWQKKRFYLKYVVSFLEYMDMRIVDADHNWKIRLFLLHVKWKQNKNSSFQGETLFTKPPAHG